MLQQRVWPQVQGLRQQQALVGFAVQRVGGGDVHGHAHRDEGPVHGQGAGSELRVTDDGRLLARIYSESDLLVAECLRSGAWKGLQPAELAAVISAMVFEARGSDGPTPAAS